MSLAASIAVPHPTAMLMRAVYASFGGDNILADREAQGFAGIEFLGAASFDADVLASAVLWWPLQR
jgi:hypothetical protein